MTAPLIKAINSASSKLVGKAAPSNAKLRRIRSTILDHGDRARAALGAATAKFVKLHGDGESTTEALFAAAKDVVTCVCHASGSETPNTVRNGLADLGEWDMADPSPHVGGAVEQRALAVDAPLVAQWLEDHYAARAQAQP